MIQELIINDKVVKVERVEGASKPLSDPQKVVEYYKMVKGYDRVKDWNKYYFNRYLGPAKRLLLFMGSLEGACKAIDWVANQGYDWILDTAMKKAPDFKLLNEKDKIADESRYRFV